MPLPRIVHEGDCAAKCSLEARVVSVAMNRKDTF